MKKIITAIITPCVGMFSSPVQADNWANYFTKINDKAASIVLNLDLINVTNKAQNPSLVLVTVKLQKPLKNGLNESREAESLWAIENQLVDLLSAKRHGRFLGRITSNEKRTFYFQLRKPEKFMAKATEMLKSFDDFKADINLKSDPSWVFYKNVLYPTEYELNSIQNAKVLDNLSKSGDDSNKKRPIDHFVNFGSQSAAGKFTLFAEGLGFSVSVIEAIRQDLPFSLQLIRVDRPIEIDQVSFLLLEEAKKLSGDYEGWGTMVLE